MSAVQADLTRALTRASRTLSRQVEALNFADPVTHIYNPLHYARVPHERYLALARPNIHALFLGMNPGPFGMAQTGVPFGEVAAVKCFLNINERVKHPSITHPKRPIEGFHCTRSEVSGRRFWSLMESEFTTANAFFQQAFVWNWCPLAFMSASGANITPDKLTREEREPLTAACDEALRTIVKLLQPDILIGVGAFASKRATLALGASAPRIETMLHPSPASPAANRDWPSAAKRTLKSCRIPN